MDVEMFRYCYHGTIETHAYEIKEDIDLEKCRYSTDFGKGFYMTTNIDQAKYWARKKSEIQKKFHNIHVQPAIVIVELETVALKTFLKDGNGKLFKEPNDEWANFVYECRKNGESEKLLHDYTFVAGPLADGKVQKILLAYEQEYISKQRLKYELQPHTEHNDQISLHNEVGLSAIINKEVALVEYSRQQI